jgi:hypothetical protein
MADLRVVVVFEQVQVVERWLLSAYWKDSSHRQLQNHRNKTVERIWPQSTLISQLLEQRGLSQRLEGRRNAGI